MSASIKGSIGVAIEAAIEQATGVGSSVQASTAQSGASFDHAACVTLADGRRFFVKCGPESAYERFLAEAAGLIALGEPGILRVPRWARAGMDTGSNQAFIVMEAIARGDEQSSVDVRWRRLGHQLAEHHRITRGSRFGFDHDNHCGATPQPNPWIEEGVAFWRDQRLGFQLRLARENGVADDAMLRAADRLLGRLDSLLDPDDEPSLIHGDLWVGNVIVDAGAIVDPTVTGPSVDGPAVIDPAVHYGHREAELAMCHLFGGFAPAFFDAYAESFPLPADADARRPIFTLYHLLNHLNLFGISYRDACMAAMDRFT